MATYSPNLALTLLDTGASGWGTVTNTNLGTLLEQAISGYVTQTIADAGDTTITIPNGNTGVARNMVIECTGTLTAARNLVVPTNKKLYFIYNNTVGGYAVTVKVSGQTGVSVPNGKKMILACDGTDVVLAENYMVGNISGTANNITGVAAVANGGTGLSSTPTSGQVLIGNGSGYSLNQLTAGSNVTIDYPSAGNIRISSTGGGGGGGTGTVTSVDMTVPGFLSVSGNPVTTSGTLAVSYSGTALPAANGGSGATTLTGYLKGNGISPFTASSSIPGSDISGNITGNAASLTSTLPTTLGGTGVGGATTYLQGEILIGNASGSLTKNRITGSGTITVTNGNGTIDISSSAGGGTVTAVTATSPLASSGGTTPNITLSTVPVANGGTGATDVVTARSNLGVPSTGGTNATGTWNISISGNAATATSATSATSATTATTATNVSGTVAIANGGTGQTTAANAINALLPSQTSQSGKFLTTNGSVASWGTAGTGTVTSVGGTGTVNGITLSGTVTTSGNLTLGGTLSGVSLTSQVSGTLPIGNGGTGQTTQQAAMNALAGATTAGAYLRGTGSNVSMQYIQSGDVPTAFLRYSSSGSAVVTASTASPTGGSDGDIWLKY